MHLTQDALGTQKSSRYKGEPQKDSSQPRHTTKQEQKQLLLSKSKTNAKGNREKKKQTAKINTNTPSPLLLDLFNVHQTATSPLSLYWNGTFRSNTSLYSPQLHLPTSPSWQWKYVLSSSFWGPPPTTISTKARVWCRLCSRNPNSVFLQLVCQYISDKAVVF